MNRTRAGGIAVGMFAVGLLTGLAGTPVARGTSRSRHQLHRPAATHEASL